MSSFVPLVARLPGAWFCLCFGWLAPGGAWFFLFFPLLVLGWLWFRSSLLGCGFLAVVCCRGSLLLPSAHALSTWGQFMDTVMMMRVWFTSIFCDEAIAALVGEFHAMDLIYSALAPESCFQPPLDAPKYKYMQ
jgi:hypothetical protein